MRQRPLRRTHRDLLITAVIALICLVAVIWAVLIAPVRDAHLSSAAAPYQPPATLDRIPTTLHEQWRSPSAEGYRPLTVQGVTIAHNAHSVWGLDSQGQQLWSYDRDNVEICSLATAWEAVVVTYRTTAGCGDVVSLVATTGQYRDTRSAINDEVVAPISSNDRVGTVGVNRVELWRSDLVRTIEYGWQPAPQEPNQQPYPDCSISSAMTRTELLALSEICSDASTWLRFMDTTPEDSRSPIITSEVELPLGARLVAIGQKAAAVYLPGTPARLESYSAVDGQLLSSQEVPTAPALAAAVAPSAVPTADLPHHMTWFDGERLYLFTPTDLLVDATLTDAIGTGVAVTDRLLYPTAAGIAVYNWATKTTESVIPVDRGNYTGPVYLSLAGEHLVEARGDQLVGLA